MIEYTGESKVTTFNIADQRHLQKGYFEYRCNQLLKINSEHFFPVQTVRVSDMSILVNYLTRVSGTLNEAKNREFYPSELKAIIWQITRLMLECQQLQINHLRLCPKAIVLENQYEDKETGQRRWLVRVKDFSFGREFSSVSEGKQLDIFQFLHPEISLEGQFTFFQREQYKSVYDIWSFGVILYHLIYRCSPFRQSRDNSFSIAVLRRFMKGDYQIQYDSQKFKSINQLIRLCFQGKFKSWSNIKEWIVDQEQIYNQLDFSTYSFSLLCKQHIKLMYLFSSIYFMIARELKESARTYWAEKILYKGEAVFLFQLIAENTLFLMSHLHKRFLQHYGSFLVLLESNDKHILQQMKQIEQSIKTEIGYNANNWKQSRLKIKENYVFTTSLMRAIQENCIQARAKNSLSQSRKKFQPEWKSISIIYDYCGALIDILNKSKPRMKLLFEESYKNQILQSIVVEDFQYPAQQRESSLLFLPMHSHRQT